MITFQHGRADWVDLRYPVSGPAFNWDLIEWVVIHYTAAINLPDGDLGEFAYQIPPYLRAIHRDYLNRKPSGYSIGYNAAVDWLGGDWELRGDTYKAAANADPSRPGDENAKTFAILMLVDGQDGATSLAAAAVRRLVAQVREHAAKAVSVVGHRDVDATHCPGVGLYSQITAGVFEPTTLPAPPPARQEDDPVTDDEIKRIAEAAANAIYNKQIPHPANPEIESRVGWVWGSTLKLAARAAAGMSDAELERVATATAARVGTSANATDIARALIAELAD